MRILAMDTATSACSVALWQDGDITHHRFEAMMRGQAEALAPMIADVLKSANVESEELDLLAVTVGPGAFTGLRIGLATARGMALAANIPCLGLTTTEVLAHAIGEDQFPNGSLLVALDSKRSDIYVQAFALNRAPAGDAEAIEPANLGQWLQDIPGPVHVVGDAATLAVAALKETSIEAHAPEANDVPDATVIAALAAARWSPDAPPPTPSPLYIRPPDAKLPRNGGRLRP
ncbi:MAG TPA: tRNA (adenosine(37)-N6)-threonylcarbamoyltransferase complex dimerization subunit type 1 TsaB [Rhodospirillales bacterium]|nr:tRNA (adenosine(37)-N6)-threonylcarbamoyltransferase complex dimerization subunit type 1 TsaB [Rhodospirillales bacterium]